MNWLLNNPISEMPGPQFLALYAALIFLIYVEAFYKNLRADRSRELGPMPIPARPDPYEIAYLRGGENEVARLVVFDLIRRGYLRRRDDSLIERSPARPEAGRLSTVEALAFDFFEVPRKPGALFGSDGLTPRLKPHLEPLEGPLRDQQLIQDTKDDPATVRAFRFRLRIILAFGGLKLGVALSLVASDRTALFPIAYFGLLVLVILSLVFNVSRVTLRGLDYLRRLREAFEGLKSRAAEAPPSGSPDPALVLVPAVFGLAAMARTPYDVPGLFQWSGAAGCGSCSSCGD